MMIDPILEGIILELTDYHNIEIEQWTNCNFENGEWSSDFEDRSIIIPAPIDNITFHVCLHEIGHIIKGEDIYCYVQEYKAERYAIETSKTYNIKCSKEYLESAYQNIIYCINYDIAFNNLKKENINKEVILWLKKL